MPAVFSASEVGDKSVPIITTRLRRCCRLYYRE